MILLEAAGFTRGREEAEASELWTAAERDAPRMHTPFDEVWFAGVLATRESPSLIQPAEARTRAAERARDWGEVVGDTAHQSCLLLTSREAPPELLVLGDGVRTLELHGLRSNEAQGMLADKQLFGDTQAWVSLVERYGGNGLALGIVGGAIR